VTSADCYDERTPKVDVDDMRRELFGPPSPPSSASSALVLVIDLNAGRAEVHDSVPRRRPDPDAGPPPLAPVAAVPLASCRPGEVYDPYDDSCHRLGCSVDGSAPYGSSGVCPSTTTTQYELISLSLYLTRPVAWLRAVASPGSGGGDTKHALSRSEGQLNRK